VYVERLLPRIPDLNFGFTVAAGLVALFSAPLGVAVVSFNAISGILGLRVIVSSTYKVKGGIRLILNKMDARNEQKPEVLWAGFGGRTDAVETASPEVRKLLGTVYELSSTIITSKYNALPRIMLRARGETEAFLKAFIEHVPDKNRRERILANSLMGQLLQYQALIFQVFQVATSEDSEAANRLKAAVNDKQFYALLKQEAFKASKKKRATTGEPTVASGN
jgi:hypothetical protein